MSIYGSDASESPVPKFALIAMASLVVGVIVLVVLIGLGRPESSTQNGSIEFYRAAQEIVVGQEIVIGVNNATLYVPKDAINMAGSIFIFPREPNLFTPPGDTTWIRPLVVNVEFRDSAGTPIPHIKFVKPAEICFRITKERWKDYTNHPNEYQVQTYSEEKNPPTWEPLQMVTHPERLQLCGVIDHLTLFALATKPGTLIPLFDPTPTLDPNSKFFPNPPDGLYEP